MKTSDPAFQTEAILTKNSVNDLGRKNPTFGQNPSLPGCRPARKIVPLGRTQAFAASSRLDAFGDYLLFRNFLRVFRENQRFSGRKIVLIGNRLWKDFALHYDSDCIDQFIEIRRGPFFENPAYRFRKMRKIRNAGLGTLICPMQSRSFLYEDAVAGICGASERITGPGNTDNALEKDRLGA